MPRQRHPICFTFAYFITDSFAYGVSDFITDCFSISNSFSISDFIANRVTYTNCITNENAYSFCYAFTNGNSNKDSDAYGFSDFIACGDVFTDTGTYSHNCGSSCDAATNSTFDF